MKIGVFVLVAMGIHLGLLYLHHELMEESHLMEIDQKMKDLEEAPEVLILGNSHAVALDETIVEGSVNLAGYGEYLHQHVARLEYLIQADLIPEKVIVSCDPGLLRNHGVDRQSHQWYWNQYEDESLKPFAESGRSFTINRLVAGVFPYMHSEVEAFDYLFAEKEKGQMETEDFIANEDFNFVRELKDSCLNAQFSEYGTHYFKRLQQLTNAHDIQLFMVRFPITQEYIFEQSPCFDLEEYYNRLYTNHFNGNTQVIDVHQVFRPSEFRDSHHLKKGEPRRTLSRMIMGAINRPQKGK